MRALLFVLLVLLFGFVILAITPKHAKAAEPGACREWSNAVAGEAMRRLDGMPVFDAWTGRYLRDYAWAYCLNQDEMPGSEIPGQPSVAVAPQVSAPAKPLGRSGFPRNSSGWLAWCRKMYPVSWQAKTQTVIPTGSHKRIPCDG